MYSIQKAAELLGKSERTVRRWMKRLDIKVVKVDTDRTRVYIADDDMDILIDCITQKILNSGEKTISPKKKNREVITYGEEKYYSLSAVSSLLGVSVFSINKWSKQDHIERKFIATDKKRAYIEHDDVLRLADLHGRKVSSKLHEEINTQKDTNVVQPDMDKLYSITEAALCLDVSRSVLRKWISQDNIEKRTKFRGRYIICITYRDILRIAELHGCEAVPNLSPLSVKEEIKEIKEVLKKHGSDIEDIKHDLRLLTKRSIYIG